MTIFATPERALLIAVVELAVDSLQRLASGKIPQYADRHLTLKSYGRAARGYAAFEYCWATEPGDPRNPFSSLRSACESGYIDCMDDYEAVLDRLRPMLDTIYKTYHLCEVIHDC